MTELPYHKAHRYLVSPVSSAWLRREAPFILALIEAPGSRLTECARDMSPDHAEVDYPIEVEVGPWARITNPLAAFTGTTALVGLTVGAAPVFVGSAILTGAALFVGRSRTEEWVLRLATREEKIDDIIANASLSHDIPQPLLRMADYLVLTDQGRYLWDVATFRTWEALGSPSQLTTYGLTATVNGAPRSGESLRALHVL
ncbi:MAG: hypothetical protein GEEBNDBF_01856 [bacterium]|nr:hypothetical protein [bacterium]